MLFKLTSADINGTSLIDCATGKVAFRTTTEHPQRVRSGSCSTVDSAISHRSLEKRPMLPSGGRTTFLEDSEGNVVAEITWEGTAATCIRIGDDLIKGTAELFDAAFVKILPDETLLPTRTENVWRLTADSLTLLDDDEEVIGTLHEKCILSNDESRPTPAPPKMRGHDYLELNSLRSDELLEMIVCYLFLSTLRERMYSITKYVYGQGQRKDPLAKLRRRATRSIAVLRENFRRKAVS